MFYITAFRGPIKWILVDCPIQLPTNMQNKKYKTNISSSWMLSTVLMIKVWLPVSRFITPGKWGMWQKKAHPGLQFYREGTRGVVSGVQHSEGARSQAQWDTWGSYWNWFQYHENGWISSTFHMCKMFPIQKSIFIIIQLPWAIHRFAFHWQDLKI